MKVEYTNSVNWFTPSNQSYYYILHMDFIFLSMPSYPIIIFVVDLA